MASQALHAEMPCYLSLDNATSGVKCILEREKNAVKSGPKSSQQETGNAPCQLIISPPPSSRVPSAKETTLFSGTSKSSSTLPGGARKAVYIRKRQEKMAGKDAGKHGTEHHVAERAGVGIHKQSSRDQNGGLQNGGQHKQQNHVVAKNNGLENQAVSCDRNGGIQNNDRIQNHIKPLISEPNDGSRKPITLNLSKRHELPQKRVSSHLPKGKHGVKNACRPTSVQEGSGQGQKHASRKNGCGGVPPLRPNKPEVLELKEMTLDRREGETSKESPCDHRTLDVNENTRLLSPVSAILSPNLSPNPFITASSSSCVPKPNKTNNTTQITKIKMRCYDGVNHSEPLQNMNQTREGYSNKPIPSPRKPRANCENGRSSGNNGNNGNRGGKEMWVYDTGSLGSSHKAGTISLKDICSETFEQSETRPGDPSRKSSGREKRRKRFGGKRTRGRSDDKSRDTSEGRQKRGRGERGGREYRNGEKRGDRIYRKRENIKTREGGYRNEVFDLRSVVGEELLYGSGELSHDHRRPRRSRRDTSWLRTKPRCEGRCDICEDEISDGDGAGDEEEMEEEVADNTKIFLFSDLLRNLLHCRFMQHRSDSESSLSSSFSTHSSCSSSSSDSELSTEITPGCMSSASGSESSFTDTEEDAFTRARRKRRK